MKAIKVGSNVPEWLSDFGFRAIKALPTCQHWASCRLRSIFSFIRQNESAQVDLGKLMFDCLDVALFELEKLKGFLCFYIKSTRRILRDFQIGDRVLNSKTFEFMKSTKQSLLVYGSHGIEIDSSLFFVLYNFLENPLAPDQLYNLVFCGCEYGLINSKTLIYKIFDIIESGLGVDDYPSAS